ncbi:MAG: YitT family protein [Clostridia bacterium]|nr:YitT family protein [Clostridia bacterium]
MNKRRLKEFLIILQIFILSIIDALTYVIFIIDNKFAPAGIAGIATMIQYKYGISLGFVSLIYNVPLCIFAILKIDKRFGFYSMLFCVSQALWYLFFQNVDLSKWKYDAGGVDTIFPCLIAGFILGFVYAGCYSLSSSTGGTDIISKYVCKKKPFFNFFFVSFALNAFVAILSLFVYSTPTESGLALDYRPVSLCLTYCLVSSIFGNLIIKNGQQAYCVTVISERTEEIEKAILEKLKHTATRLTGEGVYHSKQENVLLCVINKQQLPDFEQILKGYPDTFSYVSVVDKTIGVFRRSRDDINEVLSAKNRTQN